MTAERTDRDAAAVAAERHAKILQRSRDETAAVYARESRFAGPQCSHCYRRHPGPCTMGFADAQRSRIRITNIQALRGMIGRAHKVGELRDALLAMLALIEDGE